MFMCIPLVNNTGLLILLNLVQDMYVLLVLAIKQDARGTSLFSRFPVTGNHASPCF